MNNRRVAPFVLLLALVCACGRIRFSPHPADAFVGDSSLNNDASAGPPSCSDGIRNQDEQGVDCNGVCAACVAATSCQAHHLANASAPSGVYLIDPDGAGFIPAFFAYCDMQGDGGGWTLAMKLDGTKATFTYDAVYWTQGMQLNTDATELDMTEAKFISFDAMPFTQLRLGMSVAGKLNWMVLNYSATTLREVFAQQFFIATSAGATAWLSLIDNSRINSNCRGEGFDITAANNATGVRLGIWGNTSTTCTNNNSVLGFGIDVYTPASVFCGVTFGSTTGNSSGCGAAVDDRSTPAFGYIMLR